MYAIIKDEGEIKKCQGRFMSVLSSETEKIRCKVAFRGGSVIVEALWSNRLEMWVAFRDPKDRDPQKPPKYWNAFGLEKPSQGSMLPIVAEINFSCVGSSKVAGNFVKDRDGRVYVTHSGRFGDTRRIPKEKFLDDTKFKVIQIGKIKKALIGDIDAPDFPMKIRDLITEVGRMKGY